MTAEHVRRLCRTKLDYNIFGLITGDSGVTLEVKFEPLDPEAMMDELGFDDKAKTWVRALYETLSESDALNIYSDKFTPSVPGYSGVTWDGGYERGDGDYDNTIDVSDFVDPDTKNNFDLAAYAV